MSRITFRFHPPHLEPPPELGWVLSRAFAAPTHPLAPPTSPAAALALAERLGLLPRLATCGGLEALAGELGGDAAARLRRERALAAARELAAGETLAQVADAARQLGILVAPLKGRALVLAGDALPGTRPSGDLDLLAPAEALAALHAELRRRGFAAVAGDAPRHHLPPLYRSSGVPVELHRHLPGVRLDGDAFADWRALESHGLLTAAPGAAPDDVVRLPARDVRTAHALVHALAQHGLTARFAGWLLIGDLLDLGAALRDDAPGDAAWRRWIARDVAGAEIDAALALARAAAAGEIDLGAPDASPPARLARHFTACALDADYAAALKARWLEAPLDERPPARARLARLLRTFVPPMAAGAAARSPVRRAGQWLARPFVLVGRAFAALRASRRLAARGRAGGPTPSR